MAGFDFSSLQNNPMLMYGLGLLKAAGPSSQPHSFGQDLGSAFDYMQGAQKGNLTNEYLKAQTTEAQMKAKQMEAWQKMFGGGDAQGPLAPQAGATQTGGILASGAQGPSHMSGILSDPRIKQIMPLLAGMEPGEGMKMIASQIVPKEAPAGYRSTSGGNLEPIPGGPATKLPGNEAAQLALLNTGLKNMPEIRKIFGSQFSAGNSWDYAIGAGDVGHGKRLVTAGIEAALRAMSGAAVPKEEVERYRELYMPSPVDTEQTRARKLDELEKFMSGASNNMNQGRTGEMASPSTDLAALSGGGDQLPPIPANILSGIANSPAGQGILSGQKGMQMPPRAMGGQVNPPAAFDATGGAPQQNNAAQTLQWAQEAISKGADPQAVKQRLIQMGIPVQ